MGSQCITLLSLLLHLDGEIKKTALRGQCELFGHRLSPSLPCPPVLPPSKPHLPVGTLMPSGTHYTSLRTLFLLHQALLAPVMALQAYITLRALIMVPSCPNSHTHSLQILFYILHQTLWPYAVLSPLSPSLSGLFPLPMNPLALARAAHQVPDPQRALSGLQIFMTWSVSTGTSPMTSKTTFISHL